MDTSDVLNSEELKIRASIANTGSRAGRYIAQVYGVPVADDFPSRVLLGFKPVDLEAGQSTTIELTASIRPLQRWTSAGFELAARRVCVELAAFSGDAQALQTSVDLCTHDIME